MMPVGGGAMNLPKGQPGFTLTLTLHKIWPKNAEARSISGYQRTFALFQEFTVCEYVFIPEKGRTSTTYLIYSVLTSNFLQR